MRVLQMYIRENYTCLRLHMYVYIHAQKRAYRNEQVRTEI